MNPSSPAHSKVPHLTVPHVTVPSAEIRSTENPSADGGFNKTSGAVPELNAESIAFRRDMALAAQDIDVTLLETPRGDKVPR